MIGLDLGTRRVGVAVSDSAGAIALPYEVVERTGDRARDHARIAELVAESGAELVVVGLPLRMDGGVGPAAQAALDEADELRAALAVPVETVDERLTTVSADRSLQAAGTKGGARARRKVVDKVAASVILQAWLDQETRR